MPQKIKKRNGTIVDYDSNKILQAITLAMNSVAQDVDPAAAEALTKDVDNTLEQKFRDQIPHVEDVQDCVENTLIHFDYPEVAKSYILYRDQRKRARHDKVMIDVEKTLSEYLDKLDWRVNANSNQGYSLGGMILNTAGKVTANYWLSHIYPAHVGDAHRNADLHIHDLDMLAGYCSGWNLRTLLEEGFNGVPNKVESAPPAHLSSALAQMVNFFGTLQNEWAGAQAFSSFDTYLAPYVRKYIDEIRDELTDAGIDRTTTERLVEQRTKKHLKQQIQSFVFNLNMPSRWGTQTPFTNITLDLVCPEDLKDKRLLLSGEPFYKTFGELEQEMVMINDAFVEVMSEGDAHGRTFTFPIPTYNITKEFNWDDPKYNGLFEMTAKYGTPYFQNFINSDLNPGDVRSMCCRLQLDLTELRKRGGGLFGSAEMTGSIGVVTINAARIGFTHNDSKEAFLERLEHLMNIAKTSLEIKRVVIQEWMDKGLFPYTKRYLLSLRNHFSTIGVNGLNEAILNFTDGAETISTPNGQAFAKEVLTFMREKLSEYQEETGNLYNLEATPAEGTTYRFAKEDKERFEGIHQAGSPDAPYYTNSSQLPVGFTDDPFEALALQDDLQTQYTGGTVLHLYMSERLSSADVCKRFIRTVLTSHRLPYITITPTFSICPTHGYLSGEHDYCPKCDEALGYTGTSTMDSSLRLDFLETEQTQ